MMDVYLGLGSNLEDKEKNINDAVKMLGSFCDVVKLSKFYDTEPFGVVDQPMFLNAAVHVRTELVPLKLLDSCQEIEKNLGRVKTVVNGPRIIDIDILLYGGMVIKTMNLSIPHLSMHERLSVLEPMMDIGKDVVHPILGEAICDLYNKLK